MKSICIGAVLGALAGFVLLVVGMFLFGPCGPSSPVVYILLFPGLELSHLVDDPWKGGQVIFVVQPVFGAIVGALIGWRRSVRSSAIHQQAIAMNVPRKNASTRTRSRRRFLLVVTAIVTLIGFVGVIWWIRHSVASSKWASAPVRKDVSAYGPWGQLEFSEDSELVCAWWHSNPFADYRKDPGKAIVADLAGNTIEGAVGPDGALSEPYAIRFRDFGSRVRFADFIYDAGLGLYEIV